MKKRGDGGKNMDRLGYFGHVAIVAHPSFQLILPPEFRLGGERKGEEDFLFGWKRDRKNSLKRVLISYLPETGLSLRSCPRMLLMIWPRVTGNGGRGRGKD